MTKETDIQKEQVFKSDFKVVLMSACKVGSGILRLNNKEEELAITNFQNLQEVPSFFIPASGSGSRMFQFLFEMNNSQDREEAFRALSKLAVAENYLDKATNADEFIAQLLKGEAFKPKGLIPFHIVNEKVYTAFQEQVLQVKALFPNDARLHFTIQKSFEKEIKENISELGREIDGVDITYSYQSTSSDAYCFNANGDLFQDESGVVRRPAGHGAILENLNALPERLVCLKNIDNIQHLSKAEESTRVWKIATGLLMEFEAELRGLVQNFSKEKLEALNARFQFLSEDEVRRCDTTFIKALASRPTRVCGMVKNEGEPGGGPFWIKGGDHVTKQIVEKIQVSENDEQQKIIKESSHFNPVFIVISKSDVYGNHLDLMEFVDDSKFFVVNKSHKGNEILYRELPGLWNGGMSNWNSLFLEIPSAVFSPVKTILDLTKPAHLA